MSNIQSVLNVINGSMIEALNFAGQSEAAQNNGIQRAAYAALIAAENHVPGKIGKIAFDCNETRLASIYAYYSNGGSKEKASDDRSIFRSVLAPSVTGKVETIGDVEERRTASARRQMADRGITLAAILNGCEVSSKDRTKDGTFLLEPRHVLKKGDTFVEMVVRQGKKQHVISDKDEALTKPHPMDGTATVFVRRQVGENRKLVSVKVNVNSLMEARRAVREGMSGMSERKAIEYLADLKDNAATIGAGSKDDIVAMQKALAYLQDRLTATVKAHGEPAATVAKVA